MVVVLLLSFVNPEQFVISCVARSCRAARDTDIIVFSQHVFFSGAVRPALCTLSSKTSDAWTRPLFLLVHAFLQGDQPKQASNPTASCRGLN
jgi:hypothetical protein